MSPEEQAHHLELMRYDLWPAYREKPDGEAADCRHPGKGFGCRSGRADRFSGPSASAPLAEWMKVS